MEFPLCFAFYFFLSCFEYGSGQMEDNEDLART